ncbi:hypothetical protein GGP63_003110 [Salinibacter ruber]|nr:hypothetical protein [Salinibacter ruber]
MTMIFEASSLPFVERTGSHRLRWPYRLVSEFIPPPSCSETSLFCGYVRFQQDFQYDRFWPVSETPRLGPQTL